MQIEIPFIVTTLKKIYIPRTFCEKLLQTYTMNFMFKASIYISKQILNKVLNKLDILPFSLNGQEILTKLPMSHLILTKREKNVLKTNLLNLFFTSTGINFG